MPPDPCYITFVPETPPMFDELWSEIQDSEGEIFDLDILELQEDEQFDFADYLAADYDF